MRSSVFLTLLFVLLCLWLTPHQGSAFLRPTAALAQATIPTTPITFVQISAGQSHSCGLTSSGGVHCWGGNNVGQLGDGTQVDKVIPAAVNGLTSGVVAISAGWLHTCALMNGDNVNCWGLLQLDDGPLQSQHTPLDLNGMHEAATAISAGGSHSCLLTSSGAVQCWGGNNDGQLGNGTQVSSAIPVDVSTLTSGVSAISAGGAHTCAITTGGGVHCWGFNTLGQLGDGTYESRHHPTAVYGLDKDVIALSAGWVHTCALTSNGSVYCWGEGYGSSTSSRPNTLTLVSGFSDAHENVVPSEDRPQDTVIYLPFVVTNGCNVAFISNNFTSNRWNAMPQNRLQVVVWYDGETNTNLTVKLQYHDKDGNTGWITIGGGNDPGGQLQNYGVKVNTREYDLDGCEVNGHMIVSGVIPNGVIDGVAVGLYHKNASGQHRLLQSRATTLSTASDFVAAWPIQFNDTEFRTLTSDIQPSTYDVARFQARTAIIGAQYVQDGVTILK